MATILFVDDFPLGLAYGRFDLEDDASPLRLALSNTAPGSESSNPTTDGNGTLGNVSELDSGSYTNLDAPWILTHADALSNGSWTLTVTDDTITASGTASTFQYIYVYQYDGSNDYLIGVFDYGSGLQLNSGESLELDFTGALITLANPA